MLASFNFSTAAPAPVDLLRKCVPSSRFVPPLILWCGDFVAASQNIEDVESTWHWVFLFFPSCTSILYDSETKEKRSCNRIVSKYLLFCPEEHKMWLKKRKKKKRRDEENMQEMDLMFRCVCAL
jgi:hypothetical protein